MEMEKVRVFTVECDTWKNGERSTITLCAADSYESAKQVIEEKAMRIIANNPSAKAKMGVVEHAEDSDFAVSFRFGEGVSDLVMYYTSTLGMYVKKEVKNE